MGDELADLLVATLAPLGFELVEVELRSGTVRVVVDRMSVPYLGGATIDFVDTIEKQGFTIDNPNASGSCACGDSFH